MMLHKLFLRLSFLYVGFAIQLMVPSSAYATDPFSELSEDTMGVILSNLDVTSLERVRSVSKLFNNFFLKRENLAGAQIINSMQREFYELGQEELPGLSEEQPGNLNKAFRLLLISSHAGNPQAKADIGKLHANPDYASQLPEFPRKLYLGVVGQRNFQGS